MQPKTVLAFSGGLDTSYCAVHLARDLGHEVHAALVQTGGFSPADIARIESRAHALGVASFVVLDVTERYYRDCLRYLIYGNVLKNDTYPLSVSSERMFQALAVAEYARNIGAAAVAHGSTGAGNDQVRFDYVFRVLAPELDIITPIRDQRLSREAEIEYLRKHGVDLDFSKAAYSINQGLWGTSVGGKETLTSDGVLPEAAWPTQLSATDPTQITVHFRQGEPCGLNGKTMSAIDTIRAVQALAAPYAIGRDVHVGDTIIGIKGRVGFEAAAPLILIKAHHLLEKHTLGKYQLLFKAQLGDWYGHLLHEGQYLDPVMRDMEAFLATSQQVVTGEVDVLLAPYRFQVLGSRSPHDQMRSQFGTYGEMNLAWTGDDVKGFTTVLANAARIARSVAPEEAVS